MKSVIAILFVAFVFGAASLLAAQEPQTVGPPTVAPAASSPTIAVSSTTTEPVAASGVQPLVTAAPAASTSPAEGRADSENKPVLDREGNPDPAQNLIEYGGPG